MPGVVVLCDLGSAILTAETALDFLDDEPGARVRIVDAPLVEGGVAAAVAAEAGDPLDVVVRAAESAVRAPAVADGGGGGGCRSTDGRGCAPALQPADHPRECRRAACTARPRSW